MFQGLIYFDIMADEVSERVVRRKAAADFAQTLDSEIYISAVKNSADAFQINIILTCMYLSIPTGILEIAVKVIEKRKLKPTFLTQ